MASSGVVSTWPLPSNATVGQTAVTPSWTLVASPSTTLTSSKGEQIPGAGEVLVYSNATGKLVRRVRSPLPFPHANLGRKLAASGDIMVVTDGEYSVRAIHCVTGASLWRYDRPGRYLNGLAIDSGKVVVGLKDTNYMSVDILNATTGALSSQIGYFLGTDDFPGDAVAAGGGWVVVGSPRSTVGGITGAGFVSVEKPGFAGASYSVAAPDASSSMFFGKAVAISGTSLYVGCSQKNRVYHYDLRTGGFIGAIDPPSPAVFAFGQELSASGHLLLISSVDGPWLYDRQTGSLIRFFLETIATQGYVLRDTSICGQYAVGPAGTKLFRAVRVGGGRLGGNVVVAKGAAAGGVTGAKFASLAEATISSMGSGLVAARISGGGATTATDTGIWSGSNGMTSLMLREGAQSGSFRVASAFRPFLSQDDTIAYSFTRSSSGAVGLWRQNAATMTAALLPGGVISLTGGETATVSKLHTASIAQTGSFAASLALKNRGTVNAANDSIIARPGLIYTTDAREGQDSGLMGITHGQLAPRIATTSTCLAFSSFLNGALPTVNAAVFTRQFSFTKLLAMQKGDPAVGVTSQFSDAKVHSFIGESISNGVIVMRGTYKTATLTGEAIWTYNPNTAARHSVAWTRGQVSYFPSGTTWKRFLKVFATDDGATYFLAQISGKLVSPANDMGLWRCNLGSNAPVLILREGATLPSEHGAVVSAIQNLDVSTDGTWALLASLSRSPSAHNQVLLGGKQTTDIGYNVVARKGIAIDRTTGPSTLLGLALPTTTTNAAGMGSIGQSQLADNGKVLHRATFKEATEVVSSGIWGY